MPIPTVRLPSGVELPRLAFGTGTALYQSAAAKQVTMALNAGFRFVDGAEVYANEESAGEGIQAFLKSSGLKRDDIYVLTKVGKDGMKDLQSAVKEEMRKLQWTTSTRTCSTSRRAARTVCRATWMRGGSSRRSRLPG